MKTRNGFVSNSSSSSFIITNVSDEDKTWEDFVNLVFLIHGREKLGRFTKKQLIEAEEWMNFEPGEKFEIRVSNEDYNELTSGLRSFFHNNYGTDRTIDFSWEETYNSQSEY